MWENEKEVPNEFYKGYTCVGFNYDFSELLRYPFARFNFSFIPKLLNRRSDKGQQHGHAYSTMIANTGSSSNLVRYQSACLIIARFGKLACVLFYQLSVPIVFHHSFRPLALASPG